MPSPADTHYSYTVTVRSAKSMADMVAEVKKAMMACGFGVLYELDMQAKFREKLADEYFPCMVLGACNPRMARDMIAAVPQVPTLLPCNVVVSLERPGEFDIMVERPEALNLIVQNDAALIVLKRAEADMTKLRDMCAKLE